MPTITIRNVPDALHQQVKRRAEAHNRSLNGEVLEPLKQSVTRQSSKGRWALLDELRREQKRTPPWTVELEKLKREMREGLV